MTFDINTYEFWGWVAMLFCMGLGLTGLSPFGVAFFSGWSVFLASHIMGRPGVAGAACCKIASSVWEALCAVGRGIKDAGNRDVEKMSI